VDEQVADATRRTRLANERTYLAWLRSGLTAMAVAIAVGRIIPGLAHVSRWPYEVVGGGVAVFAVLLTAYGAQRYVRVERALKAGRFAPFETKDATVVAVLGVVLSIAMLVLIFIH